MFLEQEKLKEKKPTVAEALTQTLQAMYKAGCLNLVDFIEGKSQFYLRLFFSALSIAYDYLVWIFSSFSDVW